MAKAARLSGSSAPAVRTTKYGQFRGVDFSTDPMLVDESRSPYAVNLVSDTGASPEKRPGWRVLLQLNGRVNGLWRCEIAEEAHWLCHAGSEIWKIDPQSGEKTLLREGVQDGRSCGIWMAGGLYLLTGSEYLKYDGSALAAVEGYVPITITNRKPSGGGTALQGYNLINPKWTEEFVADGTSKVFQLTSTGLDETAVTCQIYDGESWQDKVEETDFTVDRELGTVTFTTAPKESEIPNVKITAAKTRENYAGRILKAKSAAVYDDQVLFVAGAEKGIDYASAAGKPDYFPDTGYDRVGTDATDIMGYCKIGEYLGIIKESNSQDNTVYLRWADSITKYNTDGSPYEETVYRKKQGVVGVGAISRWCMGSLIDEPLFLSERGVYALTSNAVTFERTVQNRSKYVDVKLTAEEGLSEAVGAEWKGYFVVAVNGRCYVLDSRQKSYPKYANSEFLYECSYWENVPARVLLSVGDVLYFGTEDGRVCRFNDDLPGVTKYSDGGQLDGNGILQGGEAIVALWSTKSDDDGAPQHLKTMVKKGSCVTIKPFARSGAKIWVRTEKDPGQRLVRQGNMDIFSWESIDFTRISFNSNDAPQDIMIKRKEKKYKRLQFVIANDAKNEGFGIFQIVKCYKIHSSLAKR